MAEKTENADVYKVAFASTDGINVNIHYGRAEKFYVYLIDDEAGYDFVEERKVEPVCLGGSHVISQMQQSVSRFSDCRYVAASRIGSGASSTLTAQGITAMELPGTIEDAVVKIWEYNRLQKLFG